jgi:hypothetical protein
MFEHPLLLSSHCSLTCMKLPVVAVSEESARGGEWGWNGGMKRGSEAGSEAGSDTGRSGGGGDGKSGRKASERTRLGTKHIPPTHA